MNSISKKLVLTGGIINSVMVLFHIYLCYNIYQVYGNSAVYPLLQMFSVSGTIIIFFMAVTSLLYASILTESGMGRSIVRLNIFIYLARLIGEFVLFPVPKILIAIICILMIALYLSACLLSRNAASNNQFAKPQQA